MAKKREITTETVTVTPEMAEQWYLTSGGNRDISKKRVEFFIDEMKSNWALNGEGLIFGWDDKLLDGHHRLVASAEGKVSFKTLVVRGVDPATKPTIDTGKARNQGDALAFAYNGLSQKAALGTTLMRLIDWERDMLHSPAGNKISNSAVVEAYRRHCGVEDSLRAVHGCKGVVPVTQVAWFYHLIHQKHPVQCEVFFARLADGLELTAENPIYLLRERYVKARRATVGKGCSSISLNESLALLIKAWNLFFKKKTAGVLRWSAKVENFPRIEGL